MLQQSSNEGTPSNGSGGKKLEERIAEYEQGLISKEQTIDRFRERVLTLEQEVQLLNAGKSSESSQLLILMESLE